jgi:hypothetical protein
MGFIAGGVTLISAAIWFFRSAGPDFSSERHSGDEAVESSALELLDLRKNESSQIIWV